MGAFAFEGIPTIFPIRDTSRIMPHVLKTMFSELLIDENTGRATGVGTIDDYFSFRVERR